MKAVILAGGEGTRLRPLTSNQPKPMMPIANVPMMEHIVRLLAQHGFDDIVVTVAFLANHIRNYFGDGSDFGVRMRYATEESPLGTAGSVRNAMDELDETFLVISGDVLTDFDLSAFVEAHREQQAFASIALKRVENPVEFGIVITRDDGTIERFLEKPTWGEVFSDTINTGIYVLEPGVFDHIPEGEVVDFSGDVFPAILERGRQALRPRRSTGTGRTSARSRRTAPPTRTSSTAGSQIDDARLPGARAACGSARTPTSSPDVVVEGPVLIGDNCRIEAGAVLRPYTVLGDDVVVKAEAQRRAHASCTTTSTSGRRRACAARCSAARATSATACASRRASSSATSRSSVPDAIINPSVKIYPFKSVDPGALVTSSIVWESRGARTLFGRRGVRGLANVDITAGGRGAARDGVRHRAQEGLGRVHEPRHEPLGPGAQAGVHRGPEPQRRARDGPRARDGAGHALPGPQRAGAGRDHGAARAERPRQRRDPLRRREGRRHRRRRRSARSSGCSTARTSGAPSRATSATSASRRARWSTTRPRSSAASTPPGCSAAGSRSCSTTRSARCRS